ncbi:zinc finger BED domain-containing protein RICESLEEPER 1-like [Cynara cardunculus var. scolymus]|uniref:zinc finger BED domain-containing protein RICESLEEPER 1-like n=1 Tax=Cynara cardunculus var. scolymus TaxID=59895 RepID=UPI000D62D6F7|nr:zinc finger BED domain-containing protein RICESLEEPER 1-like [Cynara cardunculus var. scolymus]XP_024995058.1 zinc finger BED domain-containing protein RICESLEEPER 1-like [Cynara cardunculus var. scolymus]XP_024995059.1 zinc finger BED domain-containing protein RICESLEEPER 1-like [Cynara cardunculus var. scolymus]
MEISDEAVLVDCSRLKSAVWKDFDRVKRGDACVAVCKHCKKKLSGSSTSGTSHLRNHLIRCRRRSNHDVSQMLTSKGKKKEGSLVPVNFTFDHDQGKADIPNLVTGKYEQSPVKEGLVSLANGNFDYRRSRFDLARMIILHGYPLAMVEHVGFKIFVRKLQPLFELATLDGVVADCKEIYLKEKQKVCEMLDNLPGKISLSVDTWAAKGDAKYLCLTAHSVDETWALRKKILSFIQIDPFQTEDMVSEVIMSRLMEWDIDRKLFSMTCDSCQIHDNIVCKIRERLSQNRFLLCNGQLFEVRCAANLIKVMVEDCLEALSLTICKIRESIRYIRMSQATHEKFNEMVQEVGANSQKSLYLDNPLHWNSTYIMLDVALEYREAFSRLQEHDFAYTMCPSDDDWSRASTITSFLKLFVEVSTVFAGSKHPTANIYFPEVCDIHLQLIDWCQSRDEHISSLSLKMKSKFDDYWKKCSLALAVAAILDPRFKMKLVEYYYPQIYGGDAPDCVDIVSNCMRALYNGHDVYSTLASHSQVGGSDGGNDTRDRLTGFDRFLHETSQNQNVKSDLDKYLEEPLFPRNVDFNILNWWKVHTPRYPVLSMMARNILGIPMSKVSLESVFDTGDIVVDEYRSSLSADTLQALICTQDWMRNGLEDSKASSSSSTLAICYDA